MSLPGWNGIRTSCIPLVGFVGTNMETKENRLNKVVRASGVQPKKDCETLPPEPKFFQFTRQT